MINPSKAPSASEKRPRPIHVAFLRYSDKMKILRNAAARLKDNPLNRNVIDIKEPNGIGLASTGNSTAQIRQY